MKSVRNIERQVEILRELKKRERFNASDQFDPYPFQAAFFETGVHCRQRLLMAGNRVGKSKAGATELTFHLTGRYPDWWKGRRYQQPITAWAGGTSNETVRDIAQAELLGNPDDPDSWGSGTIPKHLIVKAERKPGVPNAKSTVLIKHPGGNSTLQFKAYEMGVEKWMGRSVDVIWLDEEPSRTIYSQAVTRTLDRKGMVYMTFTPENGMTETVAAFLNQLKPGQSLTNASWDDASEKVATLIHRTPGHLNEAVMEQILSSYAPHEREMRRYGRPSIGSGLVFPVDEEKVLIEPIALEDHWPKIAGIDFGFDHPTAVVWAAWDREEDCVYIYDCYRQAKAPPQVHASAIRTRPHWIPMAWPHDGNRRDSMGNPGLAEQYRNAGVNMLPFHFENPPAIGEKKGGNSVEVGIMEMLQRMENGQFKVFNTLTDWFQEFRMYHRKDAKIVPIRDDLMAASRYCVMSLRFAIAEEDPVWKGEIKYQNMGIV